MSWLLCNTRDFSLDNFSHLRWINKEGSLLSLCRCARWLPPVIEVLWCRASRVISILIAGQFGGNTEIEQAKLAQKRWKVEKSVSLKHNWSTNQETGLIRRVYLSASLSSWARGWPVTNDILWGKNWQQFSHFKLFQGQKRAINAIWSCHQLVYSTSDDRGPLLRYPGQQGVPLVIIHGPGAAIAAAVGLHGLTKVYEGLSGLDISVLQSSSILTSIPLDSQIRNSSKYESYSCVFLQRDAIAMGLYRILN